MFKKILIPVLVVALMLAMTTTAFAANQYWYNFTQIKQGDCSTSHAYAVQNALWMYGLNTPDTEPIQIIHAHGGIDGIFGSGTKKAVQKFQSHNSLQADGIVGPQTWPKLKSVGLAYCGTFSGYRYYGYNNPGDSVMVFRQYGTTGVWQVDRECDTDFWTFEY